MRIALHHTTEVGVRAGRIILAERDLEAIGLIDRSPRRDDDSRIESVDDLADYDVVVTDDDDPEDLVEEALDAGINCVIWKDTIENQERLGSEFEEAFRTLLVGSNLASGIAPTLASHETARSSEVMGVRIAWTEPGTSLRRGEGIPFPDPVGARWGRVVDHAGRTERLVAPVPGKWAAAMARVTGAGVDGVVTRLVGVADLAPHLEALALAAGALSVARDAFPAGLRRPGDAAEIYLTQALIAGLEVAAYTLEGAT